MIGCVPLYDCREQAGRSRNWGRRSRGKRAEPESHDRVRGRSCGHRGRRGRIVCIAQCSRSRRVCRNFRTVLAPMRSLSKVCMLNRSDEGGGAPGSLWSAGCGRAILTSKRATSSGEDCCLGFHLRSVFSGRGYWYIITKQKRYATINRARSRKLTL